MAILQNYNQAQYVPSLVGLGTTRQGGSLILAAKQNKPAFVDLLLKQEHCNFKDKWAALYESAKLADSSCAEILLDHIIPADQDDMLRLAVEQRDTDTLTAILKHGKTTPLGRWNALRRAANTHHFEYVRPILEKGISFRPFRTLLKTSAVGAAALAAGFGLMYLNNNADL